jgi:uncharacterized repeat protein (TIGR03987 family)
LLSAATGAIVLAAAIYSIAVFAEYRSHQLKPWHLALFWAGLVFDTTGTTLMSRIAGGFKVNLHGVLGVLAIVIMLVHAGWASIVPLLRRERLMRNFHHFSLTAWSLWMISLVTGFIIAIPSMV